MSKRIYQQAVYQDGPDKSGIYKITCLVNNAVYIGSAKSFYRRWNIHRSDLILGKHHSPYLQRCWNKYGPNFFKFTVVEEVSDLSQLVVREQHWIEALHPKFNSVHQAATWLGRHHTEETRKKLSDLQKANPSFGARGHIHTPEAKAKMSAAKAGVGFFTGKKHSEESKAKMAAAKTGAKAPKAKAVEQLDDSGTIIARFDTITEASRLTGIGYENICGAIRRKCRAGGFRWRAEASNQNSDTSQKEQCA